MKKKPAHLSECSRPSQAAHIFNQVTWNSLAPPAAKQKRRDPHKKSCDSGAGGSGKKRRPGVNVNPEMPGWHGERVRGFRTAGDTNRHPKDEQ